MTCFELIDETTKEVSDRLVKLQRYCNVDCKDDKNLCEVCSIRAMRYDLRMFQIVFDGTDRSVII